MPAQTTPLTSAQWQTKAEMGILKYFLVRIATRGGLSQEQKAEILFDTFISPEELQALDAFCYLKDVNVE